MDREIVLKQLTGILLCMIYLLPVNSQIADSARSDQDIVEQNPRSRVRVMVDMGYAHWVSDRFRTAVLGKDFGFGIAVSPAVPFVIIKGRYDYSTIRIVEGDTNFVSYNGRHIGFTAFELGGQQSFSHRIGSLVLNAAGGVVLVGIRDREISTGLSASIGCNYLFSHPEWERLGIGISLNILSRTYNITDEDAPFREWVSANKVNLDRDLNIILGVATVSYTHLTLPTN